MARRRRKTPEEVAGTRTSTTAARQTAGVDVDDRAFQTGLRKATKRMELKSTRDLLRLGIMVQNDARRFCPVDTGRLRASIMAVQGTDGRGPYVDVGTNVEYAVPVEYGTAVSPAQPYMRPALLTATKSWVALARGGGPL